MGCPDSKLTSIRDSRASPSRSFVIEDAHKGFPAPLDYTRDSQGSPPSLEGGGGKATNERKLGESLPSTDGGSLSIGNDIGRRLRETSLDSRTVYPLAPMFWKVETPFFKRRIPQENGGVAAQARGKAYANNYRGAFFLIRLGRPFPSD
ncbi:hypothetical protein TNCV_731111 [Trichonephila clavipes]|nr:hypothetical protein TNCV_731111 [Trichonephila clavipes]